MRMTYTSDLWWKNAVVYCLDVETFKDGDGDGIGDFRGLTQEIDYLADLGVTCLWLMPFYPTANRDDGYDVTDFYSVDPRLGTLGDFVEFMRTAHDRGMRVIADLVVNHTSDRHPWFLEARKGKDAPMRDWFVWKDEPGPEPEQVVFPDQEDSVWERDDRSGQYYLHSFYKHQPDLNMGNPEVRDEISRILGFWMELGLAGFRVDAVPFLIENVSPQLGAARGPGRPARVHDPPQGQLGAARRGEPAVQGAGQLLRRRAGRRAHHVLRLHRHAAGLAGAGPPGGGAARGRAARTAGRA
ncbi:alpha-amylase family glycosyl hydrolase [Nonomuraea ferruginea]|uniref:alpha-amylase family glycosyl hydrolase n=1 Tax=Nonomuraea ferruginea TaxID=46174 RepID=UPI00361B2EED